MNRRLFLRGAVQPAAVLARAGSAADRRARRFANVPVQTQHDARVRFYDDLLKDKTVLIQFMYTACADRCPLNTARLARVQRLLGDRVGRDIFLYSITIDPVHDTPAALGRYAATFGAGPGWLFLTGAPADLGRIRSDFGDDPTLALGASDHLNLIAYGVEPLERWGGFPAWTEPETMVEYLSWIEPHGRRPA